MSSLLQLIAGWRRCLAEDKDFVAMGDANLDAKQWLDPGYRHYEMAREVHSFLLGESCVQLVDDFTRTRLVGDILQRSALDHIIVNCPDRVNQPIIYSMGRSDHCCISVIKYTQDLRTTPKTVMKRVYKNFNEQSFLTDISNNELWDPVIACDSCDNTELFCKQFKWIQDKHAPVKTIQNRKHYVPYITPEIKELMGKRDILRKRAKEENNPQLYNQYKNIRNTVTEKLRHAESDYYQNKFRHESNSTGALWQNVYQVLGQVRTAMPSQLVIAGRLLKSPLEMACGMNNFFIKKVTDLQSELVGRSLINPVMRLKSWLTNRNINPPGFSFKEVSEKEVGNILKKIKKNKSCGLDWIDGYCLNLAAPHIIKPLTHVINTSLRLGNFPSIWKSYKVVTVFKNKGKRSEGENYRPVALLSVVSKVLEKVVYGQLVEYFMTNGLIHPNHHDFREHHSTSTAIIQMYDMWLQAAESGKLSGALLLDLRAGFDMVSHPVLLEKLKTYGLDDVAVSWFRSYLTGRKQCVQVESSFSNFLAVDTGVPQGSNLGPLLFVVVLNDLPFAINDVEESDIVVYADDNTPITSHKDPDVLEVKVQHIADNTTQWITDNKLACSGEKTKLLVVGTAANRRIKLSEKNKVISVNVCGDKVEETKAEKILGVVVNNTATWSNHIHGNDKPGLLSQLSKRVGILTKIRRYLSPISFQKVVNGLFNSKLIYGISAWGSVWDLPGVLDTEQRNSPSLTLEDNHKLQVLATKL